MKTKIRNSWTRWKYIYNNYLRKSKYVLFISIIDHAYTFIAFMLLARYFSQEIYGIIISYFTLAIILKFLFDAGLGTYGQRETAIDNSKASYHFSNIISINILAFPLYLTILFTYNYFLFGNDNKLILLIIAFIVYEALLADNFSRFLAAFLEFKKQFFSYLISRIITLGLFISGIYLFRLEITALLTAILTGFALNIFILSIFQRKLNISFKFHHVNLNNIKYIIITIIPLGISVFINYLYNKIDVLMIAGINGYEQTAYYNIGYNIYRASTLTFSFLLAAGFTEVSKISNDKERIKIFLNKYIKIILYICITIGIIIFAFSDKLITLLYTDKYSISINTLRILVFAIPGLGLNNLTTMILNGIGLFKIVMYVSLTGLILNVILNFVFLPVYGINAAAVITIITEWIIFTIQIYMIYRVLK